LQTGAGDYLTGQEWRGGTSDSLTKNRIKKLKPVVAMITDPSNVLLTVYLKIASLGFLIISAGFKEVLYRK
jgi:hypothetical protein